MAGDAVAVMEAVARYLEHMITDPDLAELDGGLCAETDPDTFHPGKGDSAEPAKRICARCDVREACLEYALEHDERYGVWGGMSAPERKRLRRMRAA